MRSRIQQSLYLIALLSLFLSTFASLSLYINFHDSDKEEDLQSHCNDLALAAAEIEALGGDALSFLKEASDQSLRMTLIQPDGVVLWDSEVDASTMDNHLDREEVIEAIEGSMGQASRRSDTLREDSYYCALQFGDSDLVLRLGRNKRNIIGTFIQILPLDMGFCVLLFMGCLILANKETQRIVQPLLKAVDHLDTLDSSEIYEELGPFVSTIQQQNDTIRQQLESIRRDRDTLSLILKNMKEGLVTVSLEKRILSVNNSAMAMLGCYLKEPEGQKFLLLTQEPCLLEAVDASLHGENISGHFQPVNQDRIYQYFSNPVLDDSGNSGISGVILFLVDATEQQLAQKSREEFTANVSHELKTPLTSISGFAELIEGGMVSSDADVKMFSGLIRKESSRLLKLIDDIIHLSKLNSNNSDTLTDSVDLWDLVQEECEFLLPAADKRNISIHCEGEPAVIQGNHTMLQEVVYNLCENAVKYNVDDGQVFVRVEAQEHQVLLSVRDTGIGISKEHQDRIFERFYRVDKSRSKETGGTGLGLSIVKHIVQVHKGKLSIDSEPGRGTTITVLFPILPL